MGHLIKFDHLDIEKLHDFVVRGHSESWLLFGIPTCI